MSVTVVLQQMIMIFLMAAIGYGLYKKKTLSPNFGKELSALVVNVCNPALLLMSVLDDEAKVTGEHLLQSAVVGVVIYIFLAVFGLVIPMVMRTPKMQRSCYNLMMIFGNVGFIGIPVVAAVLGSTGVVYTIIFNVYYVLLMYTYGIVLVRKSSEKNGEICWKNMVNVGTVSGILALILLLTGVKLPIILTDTINYMGRSTTFLSVLVIGMSVAQMNLKSAFRDFRMYLFILIRQFLVPVGVGLLLKPLVSDPIIYGVMVLMMAVPIGNMPVMMAEEYGGNVALLSRGVVVSTVLSVITIPLVVLFVS